MSLQYSAVHLTRAVPANPPPPVSAGERVAEGPDAQPVRHPQGVVVPGGPAAEAGHREGPVRAEWPARGDLSHPGGTRHHTARDASYPFSVSNSAVARLMLTSMNILLSTSLIDIDIVQPTLINVHFGWTNLIPFRTLLVIKTPLTNIFLLISFFEAFYTVYAAFSVTQYRLMLDLCPFVRNRHLSASACASLACGLTCGHTYKLPSAVCYFLDCCRTQLAVYTRWPKP